MQQVAIKTISSAATVDILAIATIEQEVDTGAMMVTTLTHEEYGYMTIITNALEESAVVMVAPQLAHLIPE
jgi:hypothetical protein